MARNKKTGKTSKKAPKRTTKPKAARKTKRTKQTRHTKHAKQAPKRKSSIDFCDKCGSILIPTKKGKKTYMKCRGCGRETRREVKSLKITEKNNVKKGVVVLEKDPTLLPLTDMECPKCEHGRAYWWMQQTRSADEPPTQFFRCEKCKHTWREYK